VNEESFFAKFGCKQWKHGLSKEERKEKKRQRFLEIVTSNIPLISKLITDYQSNPEKFEAPLTQPIISEAPVNNFVHTRVTCDGCGVKPIVGNRWKCSVC